MPDPSDRKQAIRERIWTLLEERRAAAFPGARGRIPNFVGASAAADQLAETDEWRSARVLKCNPDAPQRYVRLRALREGKVVYMAVPPRGIVAAHLTAEIRESVPALRTLGSESARRGGRSRS